MDDGAGQASLFGHCTPGYGGSHDVGGVEALLHVPIDTTEKPLHFWEQQTHALLVQLVGKKLFSVDEMRRIIEAMDPAAYKAWGYYDKWAAAMVQGLLERGVLLPAELDAALGEDTAAAKSAAMDTEPLFRVGDKVVVKTEERLARWRKPHLRVPGYIFGASGVVLSHEGCFGDPAFLAFRGANHKTHLYRVEFDRHELWPEGGEGGTVAAEVYEPWLELAPPVALASGAADHGPSPAKRPKHQAEAANAHDDHAHDDHDHGHDHGHSHDHSHDHVHDSRAATEARAVAKEGPEPPGQRLLGALLALLSSKDLVDLAALAQGIEGLERAGQRLDGARLVAKAWVDPAFMARILVDAAAAALELGIATTNSTTATKLKVVASAPDKHHLVVCTLCSCYPLSLLGLSPAWYKARAYRARAVRAPRALLRECFGLNLPEAVTVEVHDSTADLRFLVLPLRPAGTEGWSEEKLRALVTRDSMIGVAQL
mmetsp:Transcript_83966/g.151512  ORF Transcript_83966/g.151512 Transcript_83966/m.151512 type:complete len:484 (-) Transcript_83966:116-1567(-)